MRVNEKDWNEQKKKRERIEKELGQRKERKDRERARTEKREKG